MHLTVDIHDEANLEMELHKLADRARLNNIKLFRVIFFVLPVLENQNFFIRFLEIQKLYRFVRLKYHPFFIQNQLAQNLVLRILKQASIFRVFISLYFVINLQNYLIFTNHHFLWIHIKNILVILFSYRECCPVSCYNLTII